MSQIKKFVDKVANLEGKQSRELIMPLSDAKQLRDEILKLLIDQRESKDSEVIEVVMRGSSFK